MDLKNFTVGQLANLACTLEVMAPKPGNVHRAADFEDCSATDFLASGIALGPVLDRSDQQPLGRTIYDAVVATKVVTSHNTNLGIVLLFAPLAKAAHAWRKDRRLPLSKHLLDVLQNLSPNDASLVYDAIRLASPGGISPADQPVASMDIKDSPPNNLLDAMQVASEWDWIASEYVTGFEIVFSKVAAWLLQAEGPWPERIVAAHVRLMSEYPDSLIRRKCGQQVAEESAVRAARALAAGPPGSREYHDALADLDFWLRSDGNRRNPGTTADLIAAGVFIGLLQGIVTPPF